MDYIGYPRNFNRQISRVALLRRHARPHCIFCVSHNPDGALCVRLCQLLMYLGWLGCERVMGEAGVGRPYGRGAESGVFPPGGIPGPFARSWLAPLGPDGAACVPVPCAVRVARLCGD